MQQTMHFIEFYISDECSTYITANWQTQLLSVRRMLLETGFIYGIYLFILVTNNFSR